jgi:uncharacterized protein YecE (DUF72 family)
LASPQPDLRIGTSGYQYDHWRGLFYPEDLPKSRWFAHYAQHFDTVEINNTFYGLPKPSAFDHWREQASRASHAPPGFLYVLKFSSYGSHRKKLLNPQQSIGLFLDRAHRLGPFFGPILLQLPPHWKANPDRLDAFLSASPPGQRWAVEFRDPSWLCEAVYSVLRKHAAALCIHDLIENHPYVITADWVYLRYHGGPDEGNYRPQYLAAQARRIREHLRRGLDVFAYFNNDIHGYAVANARDLRYRLRRISGCRPEEGQPHLP